MSSSYTNSMTGTFTVTHAKHLASKVAADLKRIQRFYSVPSDYTISQYESELIEILKAGYLEEVTYGFQKDGSWIEPTLRYTAKDLQGMSSSDDDPGKVRPNANVSGATFKSFLSYSSKYFALNTSEQQNFESSLPFKRGGADTPGISGYMSGDKTYSSGGRALDRSTLKSY